MSERLSEMEPAEVALVTFTRARNLRGYRNRLHLAYPVLTDETRGCYRAYGLRRGSWRRVYGLRSLAAYGRLLGKGRSLQRPTEDTLQLGGDFVVGGDGRLTYVFRSDGPDDRPPVGELVEAARQG